MQVNRNDSVERERPTLDSVERVLAQAGDAWTFLIVREAFFGVKRFDALLKNLSIPPTTLTNRLKKMQENGIFDRRQYQDRPPRFEYHLSEKGRDLYPYIVTMMQWGDRWLDEGKGPPLLLVHKLCRKVSRPILRCDKCDKPVRARDMTWRLGPGAM